MTDLDVADGSVGGVCVGYAIIHIPDDDLTGVFAEYHRVLDPCGSVLPAFQVGDEPRVLTEAFGHDIRLTLIRRRPQQAEELLLSAGFRLYSRLVRARRRWIRVDPVGLPHRPKHVAAQRDSCRVTGGL